MQKVPQVLALALHWGASDCHRCLLWLGDMADCRPRGFRLQQIHYAGLFPLFGAWNLERRIRYEWVDRNRRKIHPVIRRGRFGDLFHLALHDDPVPAGATRDDGYHRNSIARFCHSWCAYVSRAGNRSRHNHHLCVANQTPGAVSSRDDYNEPLPCDLSRRCRRLDGFCLRSVIQRIFFRCADRWGVPVSFPV